jgi:hypothetical protein
MYTGVVEFGFDFSDKFHAPARIFDLQTTPRRTKRPRFRRSLFQCRILVELLAAANLNNLNYDIDDTDNLLSGDTVVKSFLTRIPHHWDDLLSVSTGTLTAKKFGEGYVSPVCQTPSSRTWCR